MKKSHLFQRPFIDVKSVKSRIETRLKMGGEIKITGRVACISKIYVSGGNGKAFCKIIDRWIQVLDARGIQETIPDGNGVFVTVPAAKAVRGTRTSHCLGLPYVADAIADLDRFLRDSLQGQQQQGAEKICDPVTQCSNLNESENWCRKNTKLNFINRTFQYV